METVSRCIQGRLFASKEHLWAGVQLGGGEHAQAQGVILGTENMRHKRDFVLVLVLPKMEGWEINNSCIHWLRNQLLRCLWLFCGLWAVKIWGEVLIDYEKLFGRMIYWMKNITRTHISIFPTQAYMGEMHCFGTTQNYETRTGKVPGFSGHFIFLSPTAKICANNFYMSSQSEYTFSPF